MYKCTICRSEISGGDDKGAASRGDDLPLTGKAASSIVGRGCGVAYIRGK